MNKAVRAAGFAVAALVMLASASTSAPAGAQERLSPEAAAAKAEEPNLFSTLWQGAVAAIVGEAKPEAAAPERRTLAQLVEDHAGASTSDREQECLANAVYFEARGESIEGQLAVAEVVLNRAVSGRYPTDLCDVITQKAQFSFIRRGRFPAANRASDAWKKATAIAHIARRQLADTLPSDVLWYHATYVSPSWGKRLSRQAQIGLHIFYS
jgi:spore germination cell wall hydrolase CwlJ-like protein